MRKNLDLFLDIAYYMMFFGTVMLVLFTIFFHIIQNYFDFTFLQPINTHNISIYKIILEFCIMKYCRNQYKKQQHYNHIKQEMKRGHLCTYFVDENIIVHSTKTNNIVYIGNMEEMLLKEMTE